MPRPYQEKFSTRAFHCVDIIERGPVCTRPVRGWPVRRGPVARPLGHTDPTSHTNPLILYNTLYFTHPRFYTSTKSWRGYNFTAVWCLCVRLCLWTKFQPNRCTDLGAYYTHSDPIEIGDLGSKVKVTVTQYPFCLHNSLLTSLLYISSLLCRINWNLILRLDMYSNFMKIKWVMTSWWRNLRFLHSIVNISISTEFTNFIFGTNIQQHEIHLMTKCKWPWQKLKVTGKGQMSHKINKFLVKH